MVKIFLLASIIFGIIIHGITQNINVDYYRFGAKPSCIPSKLLAFNNIHHEIFFGISDPGLDSATAVLQATKRARALCALSKGVKVMNYTTGFQTEYKYGNKATYESMIELKTASPNAPCVKILDTLFTSFKEAVVFVVPTKELDTAFFFTYNRYVVEYQLGGYNEFSEVIEMFTIDSNTPGENFVYMKYGNSEDVYTHVGNDIFNIPITHYNYVLPGDSVAQRYRFGLWVNFMRELNISLGSYSRLKSERVKKMGEMVNYASENINEGVSANTFTFRIKGLKFNNNGIDIELHLQSP